MFDSTLFPGAQVPVDIALVRWQDELQVIFAKLANTFPKSASAHPDPGPAPTVLYPTHSSSIGTADPRIPKRVLVDDCTLPSTCETFRRRAQIGDAIPLLARDSTHSTRQLLRLAGAFGTCDVLGPLRNSRALSKAVAVLGFPTVPPTSEVYCSKRTGGFELWRWPERQHSNVPTEWGRGVDRWRAAVDLRGGRSRMAGH